MKTSKWIDPPSPPSIPAAEEGSRGEQDRHLDLAWRWQERVEREHQRLLTWTLGLLLADAFFLMGDSALMLVNAVLMGYGSETRFYIMVLPVVVLLASALLAAWGLLRHRSGLPSPLPSSEELASLTQSALLQRVLDDTGRAWRLAQAQAAWLRLATRLAVAYLAVRLLFLIIFLPLVNP